MVLTDEPPVWVRTPDRNLRDLIVLLERYTPNTSWISWVFGCYVKSLKHQYADPSSTAPELFSRIQALVDPPDQPMPLPDDVWRPIHELFAKNEVRDACKLFEATCVILNHDYKAVLNAA